MPNNTNFSIINIRHYLSNDNQEIAEYRLHRILSGFSCSKNPDVENFLKNRSIEFTKKNQSITYLVLSKKESLLLGYFTIALKPLTVQGKMLSKTTKKKLLRISELNQESDTYTMAAYLIAQLGKNYAIEKEKRISGTELLELAWIIIQKLQYWVGGIIVFLEAYNEKKLLSFYQDNHFRQFDTRQTHNINEPHELIQLLRLL